MKTKTYYLALAIVAGTLCVSALGAAEWPLSEEKPFLIARAYPALAGIEELYIAITPAGSDPSKDGLAWKELQAEVKQKLVKADIKVHSGNVRTYPARPDTIVLGIDIGMLKLEDPQQYVFYVQLSLSRPVCLAAKGEVTSSSKPQLILKADVWKRSSPMQTVSVQNMPAQVTAVVMEQVEAFIHACDAAGPQGKRSPDARLTDALPLTTAKSKQLANKAVAEHGYVASKNSEVFHTTGCRWAKRIAPKNLVHYDSRDEAIKAGKRPCKMCKP